MQLNLDGAMRRLVPIQSFRAEHDLPPSFGVGLFEPKDYTGLGRIDGAGASLNAVREAVLDALPQHTGAADWLSVIPQLTVLFTDQLYAINAAVGLKDVEIEFAAAGFGDVCQAFAYALLRARTQGSPTPTFEAVYDDWLNSTARISQTVYPYQHQDQAWTVQIVTHAYGRAGLMISTPAQTYFVHDAALGCPAEGFMAALLNEVVQKMAAATL